MSNMKIVSKGGLMNSQPKTSKCTFKRPRRVRNASFIAFLVFLFLVVASSPEKGNCLVDGQIFTEEGLPQRGGSIVFILGTLEVLECRVGRDGKFVAERLSPAVSYNVSYEAPDGKVVTMRRAWIYRGESRICFAVRYDELVECDCPSPPPPDRIALFFGSSSIMGKEFNGTSYRIAGHPESNRVKTGFATGIEYYLPGSILPRLKTEYFGFTFGLGYMTNVYEVPQMLTEGRSDVSYRRYRFRVGCSYAPGWGGFGLGGGILFDRGGFYDGSEKLQLLEEDYAISAFGGYINGSYGVRLGEYTVAVRLEPSVAKANVNHRREFWKGTMWSLNVGLVVSR